jgi:NAD(P)-dependent dehydrogenase (short-subunit alcohol dehydrogenase family)
VSFQLLRAFLKLLFRLLHDIFQTNVYGCVSSCKIVSREMIRNGVSNGSMILIGSIAGQDGIPGQSLYSSSKAALTGLTRTLAKELARRKIRVNLVSPGFINTDMTKDIVQDSEAEVKKRVPLQRFGTPEVWLAFQIVPQNANSFE